MARRLWSEYFPPAEKSVPSPPPAPTKMQGLWSELFPQAGNSPSSPPPPPLTPPSPSASPHDSYKRCLICSSCDSPCLLLTSKTPRNPERQFYKCPARDHSFFKWADTVHPSELIDVPSCGGKIGPNEYFPPAEKSVPSPPPAPEKMQGLWSELFPQAGNSPSSPPPPPLTPPSPSASPHDSYKRCLICSSCDSPCFLLTSKTPRNPERQFYKCPARDHSFFKWADTVHPSELIDVPSCGGCKAGICRVRREKIGPNVYRILFMCRIKEGEGSCGYRVWQDELEMSLHEENGKMASSSSPMQNYCSNGSPPIVDLTEERLGNDEATDIEAPAIDTSKHLQRNGAASGKMVKFKCQEKSYESSKRPPKRSRHGSLKGSWPFSCSPTLPLAKKSMMGQQCWMDTAIRRNLSTELQGWWGRLAFHPIPPLIIEDFFDLLSQDTNSVFIVPGKVMVNSDLFSTIRRGLPEFPSYSEPLPQNSDLITGPTPSQVAVCVPSSSHRLSNTKSNCVMEDLISNAFGQAAMDLQNKLLSVLEKMDAQDHEAMLREAEVTFAALDCLMFDHQDLKQHTMELVRCAKSVSEIKESMSENSSHQKLIDHCSRERMKLDKIGRIHADAVQTMSSSKNHLKSLRENISSTKEWVFQMETALSIYEAAMKNMELAADRISESKAILEDHYIVACSKLEESGRLIEHKKAELDVTKAAFDRARSLLRGHIHTK